MEMGLASCLCSRKERDEQLLKWSWWPVFLVSRLVTFLYGKPPPTGPTHKMELQWSKHKISPNNNPAGQLYFISPINSLPNISSLRPPVKIPSPIYISASTNRRNVKSKSDHYRGSSCYQEFINLSWYPEIVLPVGASSPYSLYPFSRLSPHH